MSIDVDFEIAQCRVCGCTDHAACETEEGPCHWVEFDLCSACAGREAPIARDPEGFALDERTGLWLR